MPRDRKPNTVPNTIETVHNLQTRFQVNFPLFESLNKLITTLTELDTIYEWTGLTQYMNRSSFERRHSLCK